jgi:hypothetical protein
MRDGHPNEPHTYYVTRCRKLPSTRRGRSSAVQDGTSTLIIITAKEVQANFCSPFETFKAASITIGLFKMATTPDCYFWKPTYRLFTDNTVNRMTEYSLWKGKLPPSLKNRQECGDCPTSDILYLML